MLERKREGPGGPKVFESKKEKKRRLILSDSESEEHDVSPPRKNVAPVSEQSGNNSVDRREEELKVNDKKRDMSSDGVKQRKRDMSSDGVKQRKESGTDKHEVTGKRNSVEELKIDKKRDPDDVKQRKEAERATRPAVFKRREAAGSDKKKATETRNNNEEKLKVDKQRVARPDAVKQREDAGTDKKKATEKRAGEEEPKVDKKMTVSSDVVRKREEADTDKKKATEKRNIDGELHLDKKRVMSSDVVKEREETCSDKKRPTERRSSNEELKVDKKRVAKLDLDKQREEASTDKKKTAELISNKELKFDKKGAVRPDVVKQRGEAGTDKKKPTELDSHKEELKFDKKRSARSDEVKRREEAGTNKKKVRELGSDSKSDRKRSRETSDAEISLKRIKTELKHGHDQTKEIDGKKVKLGSHKHGDEGTEIKGDQVLVSKPVAPAGKQRVVLNEKNSPAKSEKTVKPEAEKVRWIKRSGQRTPQKLKDNSTRSVGVKREESGISRDKGIRVQGKGGILTVLLSNKKMGGLEKVHIRREDEEKVKSLMSSMCCTANCTMLKHPSLSGGKRVLEKPTSTVALGKNQLNTKKTASSEKHKSREVKSELKTLSPEPKDEGLSRRKPDVVPKRESNSSSKTPLSTMQNTEEATVGRGTVKRKIREQIKGILLSAGWKIDLRPRRGRNYEDQVYIPPTGGSGYWSITKAYAVFQEQLNRSLDKNNNLSGKSSKKSTGSDNNLDGTGSSSSPIPVEFLSMLKRKVANKRSGRIEVAETQGSRRKKAKETTKMKHPKNKNFKDSTDGVRGRKKLNSLVGSNTKDPWGKSSTKQRGCALLVRGSNQETETEYDDYVPYIWKRTVLSWMIDLGIVSLNGKVKYMNKKQTHSMLEGQITRDGIHCSCCSKILTVSKFEIHAGSKLHQPYENIFVEESGISLLQCQLDAWEKQDESERRGFYTLNIEGDDPNDDTCGICGDGGDLICCDGCPSTFHQSCLGIGMLPSGDWHCTNCSCRFCGLVSEASAQGSGVPVSPLFSCYQCEEKYHQECIPEEDISTSSNNSRALFCGKSCRMVFRRLQKLLGVKNDLEAGLSWCLICRLDEHSPQSPFGLPKRAEYNAKIAVALAVMDECFLPIIDQRSGVNLIHNVVYNCGSNINRLSYSGFYTFILERGDEIICAASIRIHGTRLAEMPFIGTRNMYRRQGMCRRLLNGIESALCSLGIQKLIIPAISELKDTWTTVFGFKPLEISQKEEVKSINMLVFPGTGLLQKPLLKKNSSESADEADKIEPEIKHHHTPEVAAESSAFSSVGPNLHASDEAIVHSEDDVKDVECSFAALDSCVHSTSNVALESFNAPHSSEFQVPEYKSPVNSADSNLFIQPEAVCHDESVGEDKFQVDSLTVPKTKLPFEDIVQDNHDVKIEDAGLISNMHAVEDTLVQHTSEAKCTSPDATVSTLTDCGAKTSPNLPCINGTLLPHNSEYHCSSSGVTASTLQDSGGNDFHIPISSLESIYDATGHYRSDARSTCSPLFPVKHSLQASRECILDGTHDIKDQVATLQSRLKAFDDNSDIITGSMDPVTNKFNATFKESNILAVGEGTMHAIHEVRTEVGVVKSKPDANGEGAEPFTFTIVSRSLNVPFGKDSQASNGSSVTYISDDITRPVCAASGHGLQVSDAEKHSQQDSELVQKPSEFPDAALPFATEELHHNEHNSVDTLHLSSLPEPSDSSNNSVLKRTRETNNGCYSFEQNACALGENSVQYHASDMVCKSIYAVVEPISSSSGFKSCKISGVSSRAYVAYSLTPDAGNNSLDMVAKDSALLVLGGSDLCSSVLGDTHNESFGNAPAAPDHCAIPESTKHHYAEGIGELDGLYKSNDAVPAEALNNFLGSASVVVQHDLTVANEATAGLPVELNHACSEGASDIGI